MMKYIIRMKWIIIIFWLAIVVGLLFTAPNMEELVRDKGQIEVPEGYSSHTASKMLNEMQEQRGGEKEAQAVLVFHDSQELDTHQIAEAKRGIDLLTRNKDEYGIQSIMTHFDQKELEKQLVSEDGKTILAVVSIAWDNRTAKEISDMLYSTLEDIEVDHYYTGGWLIDEDVIVSSQEGLKKTEYITLGFILIILFVVFRSLIAPIIPLVTVGLSYLTAQSVVAYLVDFADFPISTFTQIFMVAVMFGIGTDYCILLISRFKEELASSDSASVAILSTYRTAGKTVFFAGLAVLVGFSSIGLSTFVLYKSAVAVAVGIAVLMIALITIVPFFMAVLGKKIFWPITANLQHKESKIWGFAGRLSLKRPWIALLIVAAVTLPFLLTYNGTLSFNSMDEIGEKYASVKGFNVISESFGPGETMPATIVIKHDERMDHPSGLAMIEQMSREVDRIEGVKAVRSASRPIGAIIEDFQVNRQIGTLDEGIDQGNNGLSQIQDGLSDASTSLQQSAPQLDEAANGAYELAQGTEDLKNGVEQLGTGLAQIEQGIKEGSIGASELINGLQQAQLSAKQLAEANQILLNHYQEIGNGLSSFVENYEDININLQKMSANLGQTDEHFNNLSERYPTLNEDEDFLVVRETVGQVYAGMIQMSEGLLELNEQFRVVEAGIQEANAGFAQAVEGQQQLAEGLSSLINGLQQLAAGLNQAAAGQGQIVDKIPDLVDGMQEVNKGQYEIAEGFNQMNEQMKELTEGLDQSAAGLGEVSSGLQSAQGYLSELSSTSNSTIAGWFVPGEALNSKEFETLLDTYMSPDRTMTTLDVVFEDNPYQIETIEKIPEIEAAVERTLRGTEWEGATFAIGGVTSIYSDLNEISAADFKRTATFMLIGIGLILFILFRSIVIPIYLIASLILTYYTSIAVTEVIFVNMAGFSGISWAVPFFAFVMLVALGIDYSIFLMDRFRENKHMNVEDAIHLAMRNMGTVIFSAVIILGGTFAAMLPSGVLSLLQIATIVLSGLALYSLIFLPFFVPVMVKMFGEANWWPFMKNKRDQVQKENTLDH